MVGWERTKPNKLALDGEVLWWDLFFKLRIMLQYGESGRE